MTSRAHRISGQLADTAAKSGPEMELGIWDTGHRFWPGWDGSWVGVSDPVFDPLEF